MPLAAEIYRKLGDESEVVALHVEVRDWDEAFRLVANRSELQANVHLEYARWLLETDDLIGAHRAFVVAGRPNEATELLLNLAQSAVAEKRFLDAAYYHWLQAKQSIQLSAVVADVVREFGRCQKLAHIYYAYDALHKYLQEPFTSNPPLTLFNISRYVANHIEKDVAPKGISLFTVLFTLAKQAEALGANKLNFQIHNKLRNLKPPDGLHDQVAVSDTFIQKSSCLISHCSRSIVLLFLVLFRFRLNSSAAVPVRGDLMIQKSYCPCATSAPITVPI